MPAKTAARQIYFNYITSILGSADPETIPIATRKAMKNHPVLSLGLQMYVKAIESLGVSVECEDDTVREFMERFVVEPMGDLVHKGLYALPYGWSVVEKVNQRVEFNGRADYIAPLEFIHPDPNDTAILTDKGEYIGVRNTSGGNIVEVPAERTVLFTWNIEHGNLYGETIFKSPYNSWYAEQLNIVQCNRFGERMGTPYVVVYYPLISGQDSDGNSVDDLHASDAESLAQNLHSNGYITIPVQRDENGMYNPDTSGWRVELLEPGGSLDNTLLPLEELHWTQMLRGLMFPDASITRTSQNVGTFGEATERGSMWEHPLDGARRWMSYHCNEFYAEDYLRWNFDMGLDECKLIFDPVRDKDKEAFNELRKSSINELVKSDERVAEVMARSLIDLSGENLDELNELMEAERERKLEIAQSIAKGKPDEEREEGEDNE
jgi:hypothetical protein